VDVRPASHSVIVDSVVKFLKSVAPFQFLPGSELAELAGQMSLEYFPKDTVILRAGMKASEAMYVIQKGAVKLALRTEIGDELALDMRGEGEVFGLLSLMGRDIARLDAVAIEDTICYTVPLQDVRNLAARHAEVSNFLFRTSVTRYMDRTLAELRQQSRLMGDAERLMYSLTVRDVAARTPVMCAETATIREAAQMASAARATCVFVAGANGRAIGIVTDRDFAGRVVAAGLDAGRPVKEVMSSPVETVESGDPVFQVLLAMLSRNIHHVLVTEAGVPSGVITHHDLILLEGKSPLNVVRHVDQQATIEDLAAAQKRIAGLLPLLMREGAKASHITRVMAEVNDRVMARVLEFAAAQFGPAPVPYCWVVYGSEGRFEQTFKTDQDNALIYADPAPGELDAVDAYFSRFTEFVSGALARCGYPRCPGNYMASNPFWRQSLSGWRAYFEEWINGAKRRQVEDALILFDMRPAGGDHSLFQALAERNRELLGPAALFKSVLGLVSTEVKPPLGFFRTFVVERTGEHKHELDLKGYGTAPIVNIARLLALDHGIGHTNTVDRLKALQAVSGLDKEMLKDLEDSFEFLMLLRLEWQLRQAADQPLSSYLRPELLTHLQRSLLKEAFQVIARMQTLLEAKYRSPVWWQMGR
jgi:CBS domain-containing protein